MPKLRRPRIRKIADRAPSLNPEKVFAVIPNFTAGENETLIRTYFLRKDVLENRSFSNEDKQQAWQNIVDSVNAVRGICGWDRNVVKNHYNKMLLDYRRYKASLKYPLTGFLDTPSKEPYFDIFDQLLSEGSAGPAPAIDQPEIKVEPGAPNISAAESPKFPAVAKTVKSLGEPPRPKFKPPEPSEDTAETSPSSRTRLTREQAVRLAELSRQVNAHTKSYMARNKKTILTNPVAPRDARRRRQFKSGIGKSQLQTSADSGQPSKSPQTESTVLHVFQPQTCAQLNSPAETPKNRIRSENSPSHSRDSNSNLIGASIDAILTKSRNYAALTSSAQLPFTSIRPVTINVPTSRYMNSEGLNKRPIVVVDNKSSSYTNELNKRMRTDALEQMPTPLSGGVEKPADTIPNVEKPADNIQKSIDTIHFVEKPVATVQKGRNSPVKPLRRYQHILQGGATNYPHKFGTKCHELLPLAVASRAHEIEYQSLKAAKFYGDGGPAPVAEPTNSPSCSSQLEENNNSATIDASIEAILAKSKNYDSLQKNELTSTKRSSAKEREMERMVAVNVRMHDLLGQCLADNQTFQALAESQKFFDFLDSLIELGISMDKDGLGHSARELLALTLEPRTEKTEREQAALSCHVKKEVEEISEHMVPPAESEAPIVNNTQSTNEGVVMQPSSNLIKEE